MPSSRCFVPCCSSGYGKKRKTRKQSGLMSRSLFKAPKDPIQLKKWAQAIKRDDRELTSNDLVCEVHFATDDIVRYYETKLNDGTTHRLEMGHPRLKKDAVPTIFPNYPAHLNPCVKKRKSPKKRVAPTMPETDMDLSPNADVSSSSSIARAITPAPSCHNEGESHASDDCDYKPPAEASDQVEAILTKKTPKKSGAREKRYACEYCDNRFTRPCELMTHKRTHTGEKPYACDECDFRSARQYNLNKHKRLHTGEKLYICECGYKVARASDLSKHKKIHTGVKPHVCDECGFRTFRPSILRDHKRTHTEKRYACDECNYTTSQDFDLMSHKRTHSGAQAMFNTDSFDIRCSGDQLEGPSLNSFDSTKLAVDPLLMMEISEVKVEHIKSEPLDEEHIKTQLSDNVCVKTELSDEVCVKTEPD